MQKGATKGKTKEKTEPLTKKKETQQTQKKEVKSKPKGWGTQEGDETEGWGDMLGPPLSP